MKKIQELLEQSPNGMCVLNVTRQIGTTTALCRYVIDMALEGKSVVYVTDRSVSRYDVYRKLSHMLTEQCPESAFLHSKNHTISIMNDSVSTEIKVVSGKSKSSFVGHRFDVCIADNADFIDGLEEVVDVMAASNAKIVIASCPSPFTGHWSLFKKLCVRDDDAWKVFTLNKLYDKRLKEILSDSQYDLQCNNYRSFFDVAKKIYANIGDLLFTEKQAV